jgi:hypothetical protein
VLKHKEEINFFENLCSIKVAEASDLISRLNFLLDNLFLCFGHCTYTQCSTGIPMGTNCAIYLANLSLFSCDFLNCPFENNTCRPVLHRLYLVCRIVDDLFVAHFQDFENFMYLDQDSFDRGIYPIISCELKYTSKSFSRNILDLAMKQRYIL